MKQGIHTIYTLSPFAQARSVPFLFGWLAVGLLTLLAGAERLPFRPRATLFLCADYAVVLLAAAGSPYPGAIAFAYAVALVSPWAASSSAPRRR